MHMKVFAFGENNVFMSQPCKNQSFWVFFAISVMKSKYIFEGLKYYNDCGKYMVYIPVTAIRVFREQGDVGLVTSLMQIRVRHTNTCQAYVVSW